MIGTLQECKRWLREHGVSSAVTVLQQTWADQVATLQDVPGSGSVDTQNLLTDATPSGTTVYAGKVRFRK